MGIKQFMGLSLAIAKANFKLRNEGTWLGVFWYLLNPLLLFGLLLFVFSQNLGSGIEYYPVYLLIGIMMFNFFNSIVIGSTKTILDNSKIIKSIKFPYKSLILSNTLRTLFSHIFEVIVLLVLVSLLFKISLVGILFYSFVLVFLIIFVFGASLITSSLTVYFFDLDNVWLFVSNLIFFGTPIFYAIEQGSILFYFNLFNPMFYYITMARELIIYNKMPELWIILGGVVYSLLFLIIGLIIFNKLKYKFAEMI